jgi:hypothetical protein
MYANNMDWMLNCCLQSCPEGNSMGFEYVDGKDLNINAAYFSPVWKIHKKWLTYEGTHQGTSCPQGFPEEGDAFCCDHVVLELWDHMISQFAATDKSSSLIKGDSWLKSGIITRFV